VTCAAFFEFVAICDAVTNALPAVDAPPVPATPGLGAQAQLASSQLRIVAGLVPVTDFRAYGRISG
jgi:hypothetical protein